MERTRCIQTSLLCLYNTVDLRNWCASFVSFRSEVVQDERAKKVLETIGHIQGSILSTGAQAGAALFQKIDNLRTAYGPRLSTSAVVYQRKFCSLTQFTATNFQYEVIILYIVQIGR